MQLTSQSRDSIHRMLQERISSDHPAIAHNLQVCTDPKGGFGEALSSALYKVSWSSETSPRIGCAGRIPSYHTSLGNFWSQNMASQTSKVHCWADSSCLRNSANFKRHLAACTTKAFRPKHSGTSYCHEKAAYTMCVCVYVYLRSYACTPHFLFHDQMTYWRRKKIDSYAMQKHDVQNRSNASRPIPVRSSQYMRGVGFWMLVHDNTNIQFICRMEKKMSNNLKPRCDSRGSFTWCKSFMLTGSSMIRVHQSAPRGKPWVLWKRLLAASHILPCGTSVELHDKRHLTKQVKDVQVNRRTRAWRSLHYLKAKQYVCSLDVCTYTPDSITLNIDSATLNDTLYRTFAAKYR